MAESPKHMTKVPYDNPKRRGELINMAALVPYREGGLIPPQNWNDELPSQAIIQLSPKQHNDKEIASTIFVRFDMETIPTHDGQRIQRWCANADPLGVYYEMDAMEYKAQQLERPVPAALQGVKVKQ